MTNYLQAPCYAVVDVETTGFANRDRIIEVAVVHVNAQGVVENHWSTLVNPQRDIPNTFVHGIGGADVAHAPTFSDIASELAEQLRGRIVVAHNAPFDVRMLTAEYERCGVGGQPLSRSWMCTLQLTSQVAPASGRKLSAALAAAGITNVHAHSALGDAEATSELFIHYLRQAPRLISELSTTTEALELALPTSGSPNVTLCQRGASHVSQTQDGTWLYQLAAGVPFVGRPNVDAYLELLADAMLDRELSVHEVQQLTVAASDMGIGQEEAQSLHHDFVHQLAVLAWADGVVTEDERDELLSVASALGVGESDVHRLLEEPVSAAVDGNTWGPQFLLKSGDRVTFTGATEIPREVWESRAVDAGLDVGGVTKKSALLVAADPDSMSGKAAKARKYGIPIVGETAFARLIGELENAGTGDIAPETMVAATHPPRTAQDLIEPDEEFHLDNADLAFAPDIYGEDDGGLITVDHQDGILHVEPDESRSTAATTLLDVWYRCHEREQRILRDRIIAPQPATLEEVAQGIGVTRERVRQIQRKLMDRLVPVVTSGQIADLLAGIREHAYPVNTLDTVMEIFPELLEHLPGWDAPLWQILDAFDDDFRVDDGWVCFPDLPAAAQRTERLMAGMVNEEGVAELSVVLEASSLDDSSVLAEWMRTCGYLVQDGYVITRTGSQPARAAALLSIVGHPLTGKELYARASSVKTERSFRNGLSYGENLVRVGADSWALRRWGLEEYTKLGDMIGKRVDVAAEQGSDGVPIEVLSEGLVRDFGVSATSVRTYSSIGEFELSNGVVRRRTEPLVNDADPAEGNGLYCRDGRWCLLLTVTDDHLRGSGFAVPNGMTASLGLTWGEPLMLPSDYGDQRVTWGNTGNSAVGSIRRFLEAMGVGIGKRVWIDLHDGQWFSVSPAPASSPVGSLDGMPWLADHVGASPVGSVDELATAVAEAIGLPANAPRRKVLARFRHRSDADAVAVLEELWL